MRAVLDPFQLLLAGQLMSEVAVVLLGAKGLAVLVGLVFSLLRLLQIPRLWPLSAPLSWLQLLQAVVWGMNVLRIGVNRIDPLFG